MYAEVYFFFTRVIELFTLQNSPIFTVDFAIAWKDDNP